MSAGPRGRGGGPRRTARPRLAPAVRRTRWRPRAGAPPRVAIVPCPSYERGVVAAALAEGLRRLGGVAAFARAGARALVKIDLSAPRPPGEALTTHPEVVRALAAALSRGAVAASVGDSPRLGDLGRAAAVAGIRDACSDTGAELVELTPARRVHVPDPLRMEELEVCERLAEVDLLVDVPKLRGRAFQGLSGAVENLLGLVPRARREALQRLIADPEAFGEMLCDLYRVVRPPLCIVDAVEVSLGGRARGEARMLGLLCVADEALAADAILAEIVGVGAANVPVLRAARRLALRGADPGDVDLVGGLPAGIGFAVPAAASAEPGGFPTSDEERCTGCGTCAAVCPVPAVTMADDRPHFDHDRCNRCSWCEELCEGGAIRMDAPAAAATRPDPVALAAPIARPPRAVDPVAVAAPVARPPRAVDPVAVAAPVARPPRAADPAAVTAVVARAPRAARWTSPVTTVVLPPAFGLPGNRASLGAAYLCGALRDAGLEVAFADVNAACEAEEPDLFAELDERALPDPNGGLYAPDPDLLLQLLFPEAFLEVTPIAARIVRSAAARARALAGGDVYLVSAHDANLPYAFALAARLTRAGAQVALGGPAVTMHAGVRDLALRATLARVLFTGEAEDQVAALVRALGRQAAPEELGAIPGVVLREGQSVEPVLRERLAGRPYPDFTGMRVGERLPIQASRGCPPSCSFCSEPAAARRHRRRVPEDVLREMRLQAERHGVRAFELHDDLLNADDDWLETLCETLRGSGFEWAGAMEPRRMSDEHWARMHAAGCRALTFGIQSFSAPLLQRMRRRIEPGELAPAILGAARVGIAVQLDVMVGHPGESDEDFEATLAAVDDLTAEAPALQVNINPFQVTPESDVALRPERYGVELTPVTLELPPALERFVDLPPRFVGDVQLDLQPDEIAARSALLAEVVYRHKAPPPIPILDEELPHCNNRCVFCSLADRRARAHVARAEEIEAALAELAAAGEDRVMFASSELSLRPDFVALLAAARRRGFRGVYVVTNGRMFAYQSFAARAVAAGATHFMVSLHGPDAVTHDGLTRAPGSFVQTTAGIRNLVAAGACVAVTAVVCRPNLDALVPLVDTAATLGARYATLAQVQLVGAGVRHADDLTVTLREAAPKMLAAALHGERRGLGMGLEGIPYCLAPGGERFLGVDDLWSRYDVDPSDELAARAPCVRPRVCLWCARYAVCSGMQEEYLRRHGGDEIRPIVGRRDTTRPPGQMEGFIVPCGGR